MKKLILVLFVLLPGFPGFSRPGDGGVVITALSGELFRFKSEVAGGVAEQGGKGRLLFRPGEAGLTVYWTSDAEKTVRDLNDLGLDARMEQHSNPWIWNIVYFSPLNVASVVLSDGGTFIYDKIYSREELLLNCGL